MNPLLPSILLAAAAWWWWPSSGASSSEGVETSTGGSGVTYAPGLRTAHNQIKMSGPLIAFCIKLRAAVPLSDWPEMIIDSGIRSYGSQARAMLRVLDTGGESYFRQLYGKAATELLALSSRNETTWTPKIEELYQRRILNPAGHVGGGAVDLRAIGKSNPERKALELAAYAAGAKKVLYETEPSAHFHIEIPV